MANTGALSECRFGRHSFTLNGLRLEYILTNTKNGCLYAGIHLIFFVFACFLGKTVFEIAGESVKGTLSQPFIVDCVFSV
jgi:hypothetical protein